MVVIMVMVLMVMVMAIVRKEIKSETKNGDGDGDHVHAGNNQLQPHSDLQISLHASLQHQVHFEPIFRHCSKVLERSKMDLDVH